MTEMLRVCACLLAGLTVVISDTSPTLATPNGKKPLWNATWTDTLKQDLLMKYDKFARPAQHNNVTEVSFSISITHIEVDEIRSLIVLNALTRMEWEDEKLKWNTSDYGGISKLQVGDHEIWQPDVVLYNSALGNSVDHYGNTHCLVMPNGHVLWVPPSQFSVYCDINLRKWPYDQHTCYFYFGSWIYDGEQVLLKKRPKNENLEDELDMTPSEWTVVSVKEIEHVKYYTCCSEPYYNIEVVVTVKRRSPAYSTVAFTPAIVCAVLTMAVFWLPPNSSDKFLLSSVTAVIICMFLVYFAQRLPAMGAHMPLVVEFYGYNLVLVCISVMASVVSVNLSRRRMSRPVPWFLSRALNGPYAVLLGLPSSKNVFVSMYGRQDCEELHDRTMVDRGRSESEDTGLQQSSAQSAREWILLATALDRVMFLLYLLIFMLIATAFYIS